MIDIGVTAEEHVSTAEFFRQFPESVARFHVYPGEIRGRDNFASFPRRFVRQNRLDLVHVKNYTVRNKINWVVEHEHGYSMLPLSRKRLRVMTSEYCRKVVFMSRYAQRTAVSLLETVGRSARDDILGRSVVLYPATSSRRGDHDYAPRGPLNLCFVGNEFVRKGGVSVWEVFNRLSRDHDIRLTLISSFKMPPAFRRKTLPAYPDYSVFQDRLDALMATRTDRVRIFRNISREEVLTTHLPQADVFLAPTFSDSFGIATLEAMAEGLPIVATNINAIPEAIEDGTHGLLIDGGLGASPLVDGALHMKHSWRQLREAPFHYLEHVNSQLEDRLVRLIEDPDLRKTLGVAARARFETTFGLAVRNAHFEKVYRDAAG